MKSGLLFEVLHSTAVTNSIASDKWNNLHGEVLFYFIWYRRVKAGSTELHSRQDWGKQEPLQPCCKSRVPAAEKRHSLPDTCCCSPCLAGKR